VNTCTALHRALGESPEVPVLPPGISWLLEALADDEIELGRLAGVIETFPGIAAKLVAVANSAWAAPRVPIVGVREACVRLGLQVVRSIAIALAVATPFDPGRCPGFDPERFWSSALLCAEAADALASFVDGHSDGLRTAGLIHHLGLLWLADQRGVETAEAIEARDAGAVPSLEQALSERLGLGYCTVGACLGRAWGLPAPLTTAMAEHRRPDYRGPYWRMAAAVGLAAALAARILAGAGETPSSSALAVPDERLGALVERLEARREAMRAMAQALFRPGSVAYAGADVRSDPGASLR